MRFFYKTVLSILVAFVFISPLYTYGNNTGEIIENRTINTKTYYLGDGKYAIDASIGSLHYKNDHDNILEQWKDIDTEIVASPKIDWDWEVIKGNWHLLIKDNTTVAIGKDGNWMGFQYQGFAYYDSQSKNYYILQNRNSVTPVIDNNSIRWENLFHGVNLEYVYTPNGFKENLEITQIARDYLALHPPSEFGLDNQTSYLVGYMQCDWQNAYSVEDKEGNPVNLDNYEIEGNSIFWRNPTRDKIVSALPTGYAIHEELQPEEWAKIRHRFYLHENSNHYLLFGAKVTTLNQYPLGTIILDPTIDEQVDASADDAYETESSGAVDRTFGGVYYRSNASSTLRYWGADRWALGDNIPQGSNITMAYMRSYFYFSDEMNGNFHFEKAASPASFTTDAYNITSRSRTTASVSWIEDDVAGSGEGWFNTPSLVAPLQEVVNAYESSAIAIIFRPNQDDEKITLCYSYDGDNTKSAQLHIEYTVEEEAAISAPTNFIIDNYGAVTTNMTWVKGENAEYTMIRASVIDYPMSISDGELIYYGLTTSLITTDFLVDKTYFGSAWGYDSDNITHSSNYTIINIGGGDMIISHLLALVPLFILLTLSLIFNKSGLLHLMLFAYAIALAWLAILGAWEIVFFPAIFCTAIIAIILFIMAAVRGDWL